MPSKIAHQHSDVYSLLFALCQEQGLSTDRNSFHRGLGKLVLAEGVIYTLERNTGEEQQPQRYRLVPFALAQKNGLTRLSEDVSERIAALDGKDLEYIALNTHLFPLLAERQWEHWTPLERQDGHEEIYRQIGSTVRHYMRRRSKLLVLGCGTGDFLDVLAAQGYEASGIDTNETNVQAALSTGRNVQRMSVEKLETDQCFGHHFDGVIDPGVLSAGVVDRDAVKRALPRIAGAIRQHGYFIHETFSNHKITIFIRQFSLFRACKTTAESC